MTTMFSDFACFIRYSHVVHSHLTRTSLPGLLSSERRILKEEEEFSARSQVGLSGGSVHIKGGEGAEEEGEKGTEHGTPGWKP